MSDLTIEYDLLAEVSQRLQLREPNRKAVESVILETSQYFDVEQKSAPFECIVDSATGVGKTYVLAGLIEYLAGATPPVRNFLIIAPGSTIRDKTIANFTRGHRRSLTGSLRCAPYLVTAANFDTAATRRMMDDRSVTKVYVFTVQALLSPSTDAGRKTHEFQEGLGAGLYEYLANLPDLVIFADEHHCYTGPAFNRTIKDLKPQLLIGLTATPAKADEAKIVYRYPLSFAIADRLVKKPVLVGRKDDAADDLTKLGDGVNLLKFKASTAERYCAENGIPRVNPVMLIIAQSIEEAEDYRALLESTSFDEGAWAGRTLLVHSGLPTAEKEETLAALDAVEDPQSPIRIIISVGMLKEGWDVKNVYVIASMRASVSEVLTEQTLGRGMRLPFGKYTGIELLDTVEVLAHERYETLLRNRNVLNQAIIDHATRAVIRLQADGTRIVRQETEEVPFTLSIPGDSDVPVFDSGDLAPKSFVIDLDSRTSQAAAQTAATAGGSVAYAPVAGRRSIKIPLLRAVAESRTTSLNQIVDLAPFSQLGASLAESDGRELIRTVLDSKRLDATHANMTASAAADSVEGALYDIPLEESRAALISKVLASPEVPARATEAGAAERIVDAVITAMGANARENLSLYLERCQRRLVAEVGRRLRVVARPVDYVDTVDVIELNKIRSTPKQPIHSHIGDFDRDVAYNSWAKNLYSHAWFDTSTEFAAAQAIDAGTDVVVWARLHRNDVPIQWTHEGRTYNPDFVVVEQSSGRTLSWLVETKQNREMESEEVQSKRLAARAWANTLNSLNPDDGEWRYLLLSETDVFDARGSWSQLKGFGR